MRHRHCEPTGRANARPMTGSAKQSIVKAAGRRVDCFVAALLAMTALQIQIRPRVPAARCARGFARTVRASENRGRRESRVANAPAASRAKLNKAHERSHHRYTGVNPAFPAQWFYGLIRALPGDQACLTPSPALLIADLTPALGRQNHTTWPYASASFVRLAVARLTPPRPPHPLPNVRDDRETPLCGSGRRESVN